MSCGLPRVAFETGRKCRHQCFHGAHDLVFVKLELAGHRLGSLTVLGLHHHFVKRQHQGTLLVRLVPVYGEMRFRQRG